MIPYSTFFTNGSILFRKISIEDKLESRQLHKTIRQPPVENQTPLRQSESENCEIFLLKSLNILGKEFGTQYKLTYHPDTFKTPFRQPPETLQTTWLIFLYLILRKSQQVSNMHLCPVQKLEKLLFSKLKSGIFLLTL